MNNERREMIITVEVSDLLKIHDALIEAVAFHQQRDAMNATLHLAKQVRYSPLTTELEAALDRIVQLLPVEGL